MVGCIALVLAMVGAACSGGDDDDDAVTTEAAATTAADSSAVGSDTTVGGATTAPVATTAAPTTEAIGADNEPVYGGNLRVALEADTANAFNPTKMQCAVSCYNTLLGTVFESLMSADESGPIPNLAESMTPNEDFTVWTITLRPGITFSDGTPLNADVVIDNINRYATPGSLTAAAFTNLARGSDGRLVMEKLDDLTATLATVTPWVDIPYYFTLQTGMMASPAWLDAAAADPNLDTKPVGTGPFVVDSYTPGSSTVLVRRDGYWRTDAEGRELPYLDSIEYRVIADRQSRKSALLTGEVDLANVDQGAIILDLADEPGIQMVAQDDFTETGFWMFNVGVEGSILADRRLRCALSHGFDVDTVNVALSEGFESRISTGPFPPGAPGHLDESPYPAYDPDTARALVDEWKADNGGVSPKIIVTTTPDSTNEALVEFGQQYWQDIGFDVEVKLSEQGKLITDAVIGSDDFSVFTWRQYSYVTPDNYYIWWHSSSAAPKGSISINFMRMRDEVIDAALEANRGESDPAKKAELAETMNRRLAEQCYIMPINYTPWRVVATEGVRNFMGEGSLPDGQTPLSNGGGFNPATAWLAEG